MPKKEESKLHVHEYQITGEYLDGSEVRIAIELKTPSSTSHGLVTESVDYIADEVLEEELGELVACYVLKDKHRMDKGLAKTNKL